MERGEKLIIFEGGNIRVIPLNNRTQWSLGRKTPENTPDISLLSPIVSRDHGMFSNIDGQWYFVDNPNSLNGTFYNEEKIISPIKGKRKIVMLAEGDRLRIGENSVLILFTTATVSEES